MTAEIDDIEARAQLSRTPCGDGDIVWRSWGSAPGTLVLMHGGSGSWRHWLRNIDALSAQYRVLAADIPGLGESAMPPDAKDIYDVARPLAAGLASLLGPDRRYHLTGFSFGANVGGHLAALEGDHVRTVTVVGAASLGLPRPPLELLKVRDKQGAERRAANAENLARLMIRDRSKIDDTALDIQEFNTQHARFRSRGFASGASLKEALEKATAPINGIWGEMDTVAWPDVQSRLDVLRAIDPTLLSHVVQGAGHWVSYEAAEEFNAALLRILAEREASTGR
nr:alpha/beta fold hydrolase [uncultured Roseococcus sp.]